MKRIKDLPIQVAQYWRGLPFAWKTTLRLHPLFNYLNRNRSIIIDHLRRSSNVGHVVEIACGTGEFARKILDNCNPDRYTAIDINPISIQEARNILSLDPRVTLIEGNIYDDPVRKLIPKADNVICFNALMHFPDLDEIFRYIHEEVLVTGGKFIGDIVNSAREKEMVLIESRGVDRPNYIRTGGRYLERRRALKQFKSGEISGSAIPKMIKEGLLRTYSLTRTELEKRLSAAGFQVDLIHEGYDLLFFASKR
jgi:SAM-dependent methyltransferase